MGALCNKAIIIIMLMDNYYTIKFYLERQMIDLSEDQIKRRISVLKKQIGSESIMKKIKTGKTYAWAINYEYLHLFKRKRALSKNVKQKKVYPIIETIENRKVDYQFEISINLKGGIKTNNIENTYDENFYIEITKQLFKIIREDLFYVIEKDKYGYNHIHIAINSSSTLIKMAIDFVLKNKLGFDAEFLNKTNAIHNETIRNIYAFREYLKKPSYYKSIGIIPQLPTYIYVNDNYYE